MPKNPRIQESKSRLGIGLESKNNNTISSFYRPVQIQFATSEINLIRISRNSSMS